MALEDQRVRQELAESGALFEGYHPRMRAVHDAHAARLTTIFDIHGWPGCAQVGSDGAEAAWLIVQHAIAHPALQRRALAALWAGAERGEVPAYRAAMLEDRVRTLEGRPQRYGTQFDWDAAGQLNPLPIEDPDGLEVRRRSVGLGPLAEAIRDRRHETAESGERPPSDWSSRQRDMERWLRETGWRSPGASVTTDRESDASSLVIIEPRTDAEILDTHEVMQQLRPDLPREQYVASVRRLMAHDGYRLVAVTEAGQVRAVAGYRVMEMLYCDRILYVDDLVTDERVRSRGFGRRLLDWLKETGRRLDCAELHLDSRLHRDAAHRFYEREGLARTCHHFAAAL